MNSPNSNPISNPSAATRKQLKNFSLSPSPQAKSVESILALWTTGLTQALPFEEKQSLEDSSSSPSSHPRTLWEAFPDLISEKPFFTTPRHLQPLNVEEQKAAQTSFYNSQKRVQGERGAMTSISGPQNISGSLNAASGVGHSSSRFNGNSSLSSSNVHHHHNSRNSTMNCPSNSSSSGNGNFHHSSNHHPRTTNQKLPRNEDSWSNCSREIGVFDEGGVFRAVNSSTAGQASSSSEVASSSSSKSLSKTKDGIESLNAGGGASIEPNLQVAANRFSHNSTAESSFTTGTSKPVFERLRGEASPFREKIAYAQPSIYDQQQLGNASQNVVISEQVSSSSTIEEERWLYRDPSGNIQGPFSNREMLDWFQLGYFPPTLPIKRVSDPGFEPLGQVIQRTGSIPFTVVVAAASCGIPSGSKLNGLLGKGGGQQAVAPTVSTPPSSSIFENDASSSIILPSNNSLQSCGSSIEREKLEEMLLKDLKITPVTSSKNVPSQSSSCVNHQHQVKVANLVENSQSKDRFTHAVENSHSKDRFTHAVENSHSKTSNTKAASFASAAASSSSKAHSVVVESSSNPNAANNKIPTQSLTWTTQIASTNAPSIEDLQKEETAAAASSSSNHLHQKSKELHQKPLLTAPIVSGFSWNTKPSSGSPVKSLEEIMQQEASKKQQASSTASCTNNASSVPVVAASSSSVPSKSSMSEILQRQIANQGSNPNSSLSSNPLISFKSALEQQQAMKNASLSQKTTASTNQQSNSLSAGSGGGNNNLNSTGNLKNSRSNISSSSNSSNHQALSQELLDWVRKELAPIRGSYDSSLDLSTFVGLLLDLDSTKAIKEAIEDVLGVSSRTSAFTTEFLRRAKLIVEGLKTEDDEYVVVGKKGKKK